MRAPAVIPELLRRPETTAFAARTVDGVTFHSPAADYRGRQDVEHILSHIRAVLDEVVITRTVSGSDTTVSFLTAAFDGAAMDGVIEERYDAGGLLTEATLFLRPYAALRAAIKAMGARLGEDPLPSGLNRADPGRARASVRDP